MFRFHGGAPWVIARNETDAQHVLAADDRGRDGGYDDLERMPDDELFTMIYEDIPKGLTPDCDCPPDEIEDEGYCPNCGYRNSVTLTVAEWCAKGDYFRDPVIWEWQS